MSDSDKDTEYYAASVGAWFSTKLERDKSLITLATGGIGLLVTLVSTVGVTSIESLVLYILAIVSFLICVGAVLWIFNQNAAHLKAVIKEKAQTDPVLAVLDSIAIVSFCAGVVFSSVIGISQAANSFLSKEKTMALERGRSRVQDSFNGAAAIKPDAKEFSKSFNGAAALKPNTSQGGGAGQATGAGAAQGQGQGQNQGQGATANQGTGTTGKK